MKLITPEIEIDLRNPFKNDCLERKHFAERLTNLITRVEDNLVISIDAQWGDGKTTFVKMWQAFLEQDNIKCIYFDAFKNDYFDDPFVALIGNTISLLEKSKINSTKLEALKTNASKIGAQLLSLGARVGIRAAMFGAIQDDDIDKAKKIIKEATSNTTGFTSKIIEEKIKTYKEDIDAIDEFKEKLSNLAQEAFKKQNKPLVFIVDELDRCKPTYALELIEKIKHLFSVKNIVFVLVMHTQQLEESIKCIYGPNIDARTYLQKFINIECKLPKEYEITSENDYKKYCDFLYNTHELNIYYYHGHLTELNEIMRILSQSMRLSLRDLQRCYTNLVIFYSSINKVVYGDPYLAGFLTIMKVKNPNIFEELKRSHISFGKLNKEINIEELVFTKKDKRHIEWLQKVLKACLMPEEELKMLDDNAAEKGIIEDLRRKGLDREDAIPRHCEEIESLQFVKNQR